MPTYQLILFVFCCAFVAPVARADDWTASCPIGCVCKWTNGKKSVKCNDQQLTTIPATLHTDVQSLQLNGNNIVTLGREVFTALGLVNLQRIYLKGSHIATISRDAFRNLKILVELDLSENAIEALDKQTFNGNDRLRYLYLYGNPLKRLDAYQFPALPHLRTLDLHDCQISQIEATAFANLELLELLNLKNNLVEIVDEHVFNYMRNLKTLVLEGNPWKCNCKLRRFRNWYINSNLNSLSLMCSSPFVFKNKQWEEVEEIQFACPPKVDIYTDNIFNIDIGSNVTFGCLIYGDPLPAATWDFNGKEFDADNVSFDEEQPYTDTLWRNLTIFNITNFDAGVYVCSAKNNGGRATANISLTLTEMVQHVIEKGPETFWYFGLILGTFGTVFGLIMLAILVCWCKKATQRRRSLKNIKGSVSFNDQEKKLLDLSITTNDRQDSCEMGQTQQQQHAINSSTAGSNPAAILLHHQHHQQHMQHQQQHSQIQSNGLALEPIHITIETQHQPHQQQQHVHHQHVQHHQQQQQQHQMMNSPMSMALAMVASNSGGLCSGNAQIAESTTTTTSASNSSTSGQSTASSISQPSSMRGTGVGPSAAAAAAAATASHHHHQQQQQQQHRVTCPLSRVLPAFRTDSTGQIAPYGGIFIALAMSQDEHSAGSASADYRIYPDLLNETQAQQQLQQLQPPLAATAEAMAPSAATAAAAYATLPRNHRQMRSTTGSAASSTITSANGATATTKFLSRLPEYDEAPDLQHTTLCNNLCLQNLINYHNLEARLCGNGAHHQLHPIAGQADASGSSSLCALCLRDAQDIGSGGGVSLQLQHHQQQQQQPQQHQLHHHHLPYRVVSATAAATTATTTTKTPGVSAASSAAAAAGPKTATLQRMSSADNSRPSDDDMLSGCSSLTGKYDNMGRRITASGNSTLSLPDEDDELQLQQQRNGSMPSAAAAAAGHKTTANHPAGTTLSRRGSFVRESGAETTENATLPSVSRLVLPVGCDYVSL